LLNDAAAFCRYSQFLEQFRGCSVLRIEIDFAPQRLEAQRNFCLKPHRATNIDGGCDSNFEGG